MQFLFKIGLLLWSLFILSFPVFAQKNWQTVYENYSASLEKIAKKASKKTAAEQQAEIKKLGEGFYSTYLEASREFSENTKSGNTPRNDFLALYRTASLTLPILTGRIETGCLDKNFLDGNFQELFLMGAINSGLQKSCVDSKQTLVNPQLLKFYEKKSYDELLDLLSRNSREDNSYSIQENNQAAMVFLENDPEQIEKLRSHYIKKVLPKRRNQKQDVRQLSALAHTGQELFENALAALALEKKNYHFFTGNIHDENSLDNLCSALEEINQDRKKHCQQMVESADGIAEVRAKKEEASKMVDWGPSDFSAFVLEQFSKIGPIDELPDDVGEAVKFVKQKVLTSPAPSSFFKSIVSRGDFLEKTLVSGKSGGSGKTALKLEKNYLKSIFGPVMSQVEKSLNKTQSDLGQSIFDFEKQYHLFTTVPHLDYTESLRKFSDSLSIFGPQVLGAALIQGGPGLAAQTCKVLAAVNDERKRKSDGENSAKLSLELVGAVAGIGPFSAMGTRMASSLPKLLGKAMQISLAAGGTALASESLVDYQVADEDLDEQKKVSQFSMLMGRYSPEEKKVLDKIKSELQTQSSDGLTGIAIGGALGSLGLVGPLLDSLPTRKIVANSVKLFNRFAEELRPLFAKLRQAKMPESAIQRLKGMLHLSSESTFKRLLEQQADVAKKLENWACLSPSSSLEGCARLLPLALGSADDAQLAMKIPMPEERIRKQAIAVVDNFKDDIKILLSSIGGPSQEVIYSSVAQMKKLKNWSSEKIEKRIARSLKSCSSGKIR